MSNIVRFPVVVTFSNGKTAEYEGQVYSNGKSFAVTYVGRKGPARVFASFDGKKATALIDGTTFVPKEVFKNDFKPVNAVAQKVSRKAAKAAEAPSAPAPTAAPVAVAAYLNGLEIPEGFTIPARQEGEHHFAHKARVKKALEDYKAAPKADEPKKRGRKPKEAAAAPVLPAALQSLVDTIKGLDENTRKAFVSALQN